MKCIEARELMNAYIDNTLSEKELQSLEKHLDSCESCTVEFEEFKYMVQLMGEIELKELPEGFEEELHDKLVMASGEIANQKHQNETTKSNHLISIFKNSFIKKKYYRYAAIPAVLLLVIFAAKGFWPNLNMTKSDQSVESYVMETTAASMMDNEMAFGGEEESKMAISPTVGDARFTTSFSESQASDTGEVLLKGTGESSYETGRMIIQTSSIQMDVEGFDDKVAQIKAMVEASGGYVENENSSYRFYVSDEDNLKYGYLTLRVPEEGYSLITDSIKELGRVTSDASNATDITKQYRDTAAEIENLKVTEQRLREIMSQAVEISDILSIENELTRIRGNISSYEKQMKDWENLVSLTTITVTLNEVKNLKPIVEPIDNSLWSKAKEGFIGTINSVKTFFENLVIWVIAKSPYLVSLGVLGLIIKHFYFKRRK